MDGRVARIHGGETVVDGDVQHHTEGWRIGVETKAQARRAAREPVVRIDNEREANGIPLGTTAKVVVLQGGAQVESAGVAYESGKRVVRHTPKQVRFR
jgi:hypothetical protein